MKSIIAAKTTTKIAYMENPPAEGGEIKYLTNKEFQQKFNCEYTEGVVVKQSKRNPATESDFKDARAKAAYVRLLQPLENLVICKMTDDIGYGLFTTKDIPMGTVICLYAGEYDPGTTEFVYSYGGINAAKIGGIARFMQHQPISKDNHETYLMQGLKDHRLFALQENIPEEQAKNMLSNSDFVAQKVKEYRKKIEENVFFLSYDFKPDQFSDEKHTNQIAQSNVSIESTKVAGVDVILMVASCDIKKNESIGFSYGIMYWRHPSIHKPPLLFTKMGKIIKDGFEKTAESRDARLQKLENLSSMLKEMEHDYESDDDNSEDRDSDDSVPGSQLIGLINLMKSLKTEINSPAKPNILHRSTEEVETQLKDKTLSFFGKSPNTQWKKYPEAGLVGKYIGHQVRFFTLAADETTQAKAFTEQLQKEGFDVELKKAKDKPSLVVDLTTSVLTPR